jgi:hypothetical protein
VVDQVVGLVLLVALVLQVEAVEHLPLVAHITQIKVTLVVQETFTTAVAVAVEAVQEVREALTQ